MKKCVSSAPPCIYTYIYEQQYTYFTCTKIYKHQALVSLLHVSARLRCHHQGGVCKVSFINAARSLFVT
jgi:hypothetical protein